MAADERGRSCDAATSRISAYWCTRIVSVGPCVRGSTQNHDKGQPCNGNRPIVAVCANVAANVECDLRRDMMPPAGN